jgi:hypothetical protein
MGIELFGRLLICKGASARPPRFISRQRGAKSNYHLRCLILQIIANKFTAGLTPLWLLCVQVCVAGRQRGWRGGWFVRRANTLCRRGAHLKLMTGIIFA